MSFYSLVDIADILFRRFENVDGMTGILMDTLSRYEDIETMMSETQIHEKLCLSIDRYGDYMGREETAYLLRTVAMNADSFAGILEEFSDVTVNSKFSRMAEAFLRVLSIMANPKLPLDSSEDLAIFLRMRDNLYSFANDMVANSLKSSILNDQIRENERDSFVEANLTLATFFLQRLLGRWTTLVQRTAAEKGITFVHEYEIIGYTKSKSQPV